MCYYLNVLQLGLVVSYEVLVGLPGHGPQFDDFQKAVAAGKGETVVPAPGAQPREAFVQLVWGQNWSN